MTKCHHAKKDDDDDSLSHWCSSPERFADKLGMTVQEVQERKAAHIQASNNLQNYISTLPADQGKLKHQMVCQHRYEYGKYPFVCNQCWSYQPICMCETASSNKLNLPKRVNNVILWTHHREWGSVSNSGSLLPLILHNTKLLMKGLPQHDEEIEALFQQQTNRKIVVLWPDNDTSSLEDKELPLSDPQRISWQDLQQQQDDQEEPITLLALEGTWRTTRRMAKKLPPHHQQQRMLKVALPPDLVFWKSSREETSILNPLRRQKGDGFSRDNVCTAEAIAAALVGLGMEQRDGQAILDLLAHKVDLTRRYQGKSLSFRD